VPQRPTRDADLLGFGADDVDSTVKVFKTLCGMTLNDGITFAADAVRGSQIREQASYGGVRIDIPARLDGARIALQVDIGFGDAVTPAPEMVDYPVLLDDLPVPIYVTQSKPHSRGARRRFPNRFPPGWAPRLQAMPGNKRNGMRSSRRIASVP